MCRSYRELSGRPVKLKKTITAQTKIQMAVITGIPAAPVSFNHAIILRFGCVRVHGISVTFAAVLPYCPEPLHVEITDVFQGDPRAVADALRFELRMFPDNSEFQHSNLLL